MPGLTSGKDPSYRFGLWLVVFCTSCGPAPVPRVTAEKPAPSTEVPAPVVDPCAQVPGQPAPAPLARAYTGLAREARCQPEVIAIMKGVSAALGVRCQHCHVESDYGAPTEQKRIADWMSLELMPRLRKHDGSSLSCQSCHATRGKPRAKLLGQPRSESFSIEWMNAELVANFQRADGGALRCKTCHADNLGSPGFQRRLIGTDLLARGFASPAADSPSGSETLRAAP